MPPTMSDAARIEQLEGELAAQTKIQISLLEKQKKGHHIDKWEVEETARKVAEIEKLILKFVSDSKSKGAEESGDGVVKEYSNGKRSHVDHYDQYATTHHTSGEYNNGHSNNNHNEGDIMVKRGDGTNGIDDMELIANDLHSAADWGSADHVMNDKQFLECLDSDATSTTTQFADANSLASPFPLHPSNYNGHGHSGNNDNNDNTMGGVQGGNGGAAVKYAHGHLAYMQALGLRLKSEIESAKPVRERSKSSKRKQPAVDYSMSSYGRISEANEAESKPKKKRLSRKESEKVSFAANATHFPSEGPIMAPAAPNPAVVTVGDPAELSDHEDLCTVCRTPGELLCCETCELVYHLGCLKPQLKKVPGGAWLCPHCTKSESWKTFSTNNVLRDYLLFSSFQTKELKFIETSNVHLSKEVQKLNNEVDSLEKRLAPLKTRLANAEARNSKASSHILSLSSALNWIIKLSSK